MNAKRLTRIGGYVTCLAAVLLLAAETYVFESARPDWPSFYAGAKLAKNVHGLYSLEQPYAITSQFHDKNQVWAFVRPPVYAWLLQPLGWLAPLHACLAWKTLNLFALLIFVWLFWPHPLSLFVLAISPVGWGLLQGQDVGIWLFLIGLGIASFRRHKDFWGGVFFGLCGIKLHLLLTLPAYFVARKKWRMAAGFAVGGSSLLMGCFGIYGTGWITPYWTLLQTNEALIDPSTTIAKFLHVPWWTIVLAMQPITWGVCRWRAKSEEFALLLALAFGMIAAPRLYTYDKFIAMPLFLHAIRNFLERKEAVKEMPAAGFATGGV